MSDDKQAPILTGEAESERPTLYVVDGSYYIYRAYFASPPLTTRGGQPTNALFVFTNMLLSLIREHAPDHLAVAFDPSGPSFRAQIYPEYKAHRDEPPAELTAQLPYFRPIVRGLGVPVLEAEGYEADDVMGAIARKADEAGLRTVLVSGDKDLMQLLRDGHVEMLDTMASRRRRYTVKDVIERFQVGPEGVADVLALAGDSSDNIPGVPGIGEKTAGKLIAEFGSLEAVLADIDRVSGKKRKENLRAHADKVRVYKALTVIRADVEVDLDVAALRVGQPERETLLPLFVKLEFHKLIDELKLREGGVAERVIEAPEEAPKRYETITEQAAFDAALEALAASEVFCVDLETTDLDPMKAEIVGVALAWEADHGVYVPLRHRYLGVPEQLDAEAVIEALRPLLEADAPEKVAQNGKYERIIFARHGLRLGKLRCDPMLASYVLDPGRKSHGLDALAQDLLGHRTIRYEEVAGKGKKQVRFDQVDIERATPYAAEDADITLALARRLLPELDDAGLRSLHDDVELPVSRVLATMERHGIRVDVAHLEALSDELLVEMNRLEAEARGLIGRTINLNSPKQIGEVLYEQLGLVPRVRKRTTHGFSTNQETLESMLDMHRLPGLILDYRSVAKLRSTYAEALPALVLPATGRVHTSFNQAIASTGRLSSSNPNLQNIPVRTEQGRRIRRAFLPEAGWQLVSLDYSQIELRLMAHFSGDHTMLSAFAEGHDIHARAAAEIFQVPLDAVSKDQRRAGKTVNFAVLYGMGASSLSRSLEIGRDEAQNIINDFFERFSDVKAFFDSVLASATWDGYVTTLLGRRRYIPELSSRKNSIKRMGERFAMNTPIQGTAADLIKLAMIQVQRRLEGEGFASRMLLQVHDELVFEAPPAELDRLITMARQEMEQVHPLSVALRVDCAVGPNWADLTAYEPAAA